MCKIPCDHCDYKATERGSLLKHIKSLHEGIKFPCEQCDHEDKMEARFIGTPQIKT